MPTGNKIAVPCDGLPAPVHAQTGQQDTTSVDACFLRICVMNPPGTVLNTVVFLGSAQVSVRPSTLCCDKFLLTSVESQIMRFYAKTYVM